MRSLVVGGHGRGVGKTALAVDVIRAFPEAGWTAVKISTHGHGAWHEPPVETEGVPRAVLVEETVHTGRTDTSRFLGAGARRAFWLRVQADRLADGVALLRPILDEAEYVVLEGNSILEFIQPDLFLMVIDPARPEFKPSAVKFAGRAHAFVVRSRPSAAQWEGLAEGALGSRPVFEQAFGHPLPGPLLVLIQERLFGAMHPGTPGEHLPG